MLGKPVMSELLDIYSIIFLVLAVAIFFRLRSVLGRRTGNERQPFDPYSSREADTRKSGNDNVITLPRGGDSAQPAEATENPDDERIERVAPEGSALYTALRTILSADSNFDPAQFVVGARGAYEMIVTAFAAGDRKALKPLLSRDVYEGFQSAISDRESRGETVDSTFVGIDKATIVEAAMKDKVAQVTVRFHSQLISATKDKEGRIIDGDPNKVAEVTDIWTFSRDTRSRDPNWKLIATESAE